MLSLFFGLIFLLGVHPYEVIVDTQTAVNIPPREISFQYQSGPISKSPHNISIVGDDFMLDGKRFHIVSGSVHYFRMPHQYWRDRLRKLKAVGFNAVATYVEWSYHEPEERQYRFTEDYDVAEFIRIAAEEGLWVLLRPGPYICAERDLGGLPYWLLSKYPNIKLRTTDKGFILESRIWMTKLFEYVSPYLAGNGGPIILVQVENEYGSYGNSMPYKVKIRDMMKEHVGDKALLYTTDGTFMNMIRNGAVPETLTTIDFGADRDFRRAFRELRNFMPSGPLMNSEFYPGWLTHWSEHLQQVDKERVVRALRDMLNNGIHVNMYVFFGGTNFEHSAGANFIITYLPDITSYDYDAPLSEAGDPTPKYYAIRQLMETYLPNLRNTSLPTPSPKGEYGIVTLERHLELFSEESISKLGKEYPDVTGSNLPTFEKLRQRAGLVVYQTVLTEANTNSSEDSLKLRIRKPRDRIYVFVSGKYKGVINRMLNTDSVIVDAKPNSVLTLVVESQGRINYGARLRDYKGILGAVELNGKVLNDMWSVTGFPLENVDVIDTTTASNTPTFGPVFYRGEFSLPQSSQTPLDTFLDVTGWIKGYVWVNGHNLGRYWPEVGPQVTLYVPGVWLNPGSNTIVILELEARRGNEHQQQLTVTFIDHPILNRTTSLEQIEAVSLIMNTN